MRNKLRIYLIITILFSIVVTSAVNAAEKKTVKQDTTKSNTKIAIKSIMDVKISVELNEEYLLPDNVEAVMSDNKKKFVPISWNVDVIDTKKIGTKSYFGTVKGYSKKVNLIVDVVADVIKINPLEVQTIQGVYYQLPYKVYALMNNNKIKKVAVEWNKEIKNCDTIGEYDYLGSVIGYSDKVKLHLSVVKPQNGINKVFYEYHLPDMGSLENIKGDIDLTLSNCENSSIMDYGSPKNMKRLQLSYCSISFLDIAQNIPNVEELKLKCCSLTSIDIDKKNTCLKTIEIEESEIVSMDITAICKELSKINITNCDITNFQTSAPCKKMTEVEITNTDITNIQGLVNFDNLKKLNLSGSRIDKDEISDLSSLTELDLSNLEIEDIEFLASLTSLIKLNLTKNSISDISPLKNLVKLNSLLLANNQIDDFSPVSSFYSNLIEKDFSLK